MTNKKKFISVFFALFFVFGCQKQIQLSNGRVIYQPFDGGNQIIQAQPSTDNSTGVNPSVPNVGDQLGNGLTQLATPAVAGATLGSELVGNTGGNGNVDMTNGNNAVNTNGSQNNNGNNLTQYQQPNNAVNNVNATNNPNVVNQGTANNSQSLEDAINQSFGGKTQDSAMVNNSGVSNSSFSGQAPKATSSASINNISNASSNVSQVAQNVAKPSGNVIQVGNYANANTANNIANKLKSQGFDASVISSNGTNKIVVGNFATKEAGSSVSQALKALGYSDAFMTMLE